MISNACASCMTGVFKNIFLKDFSHNSEKCCLRPRKEVLPYAASYIIKFVLCYLFLVIFPDCFLTLYFHITLFAGCDCYYSFYICAGSIHYQYLHQGSGSFPWLFPSKLPQSFQTLLCLR